MSHNLYTLMYFPLQSTVKRIIVIPQMMFLSARDNIALPTWLDFFPPFFLGFQGHCEPQECKLISQWQQNTFQILRRWQRQWELLEKANISVTTPHATKSLLARPWPSAENPSTSQNHRCSSQAGSLLNCRALEDIISLYYSWDR